MTVGDTWITDITHFPGSTLDQPVPAQVHPAAYRMGRFMGAIVASATSVPDDGPRETGLRCRRRPARRACPGYLIVQRLDESEQIRWQCSRCDDNGLISGWHGCVWDFTQTSSSADARPRATVYLDDDGYALLRSAQVSMDRDTERAVMAAQHTGRGIRLSIPPDLLEDLVGAIAFEANHEETRERQRRLDELADLFDRAR